MKELSPKVKETIGTVVIILVFAVIIIWNLWAGINGLFLSKKHVMDDVFIQPLQGCMYEGQISYVSNQQKEFNRTINHRWAGTEYYYVVFSKEKDRAVLVRAPKNWNADFGTDYCNQVSLETGGIVKELDYKTKKAMSNFLAGFESKGIQIRTNVYLDLLAKRICWMQIFAGISIALCLIYCIVLLKKLGNGKPIKKWLAVIMLILFLTTLFAMLYLRNVT